jgi:GT2 family glycosyltransferase
LDKNYGFAEGYNKALSQVDADYYVLLNSDIEVEDDWLTPLVDYMDAHPEIAACQPKIRSFHNKQYFEYAGAAGGYIDKLGYPFCRGRIFDSVEKDEGQYDAIRSVFWATGAAMMVRRDVYFAVGGLDGRFFAHMEEIDLCWRMRSRGYGIVCVPASKVYHVGGGTLPKENSHKTFLNFRNNLYMLYKNLPETELKLVLRQRYWLDILAAFVFLLKGEVRSFRAVFAAHREFDRTKSDFLLSRQENMLRTNGNDIPEILKGSILWAYHIKRKKHYSQLQE